MSETSVKRIDKTPRTGPHDRIKPNDPATWKNRDREREGGHMKREER